MNYPAQIKTLTKQITQHTIITKQNRSTKNLNKLKLLKKQLHQTKYFNLIKPTY